MKVEILTIFPEIFTSFLSTSLIGKAVDKGLLKVTTTNIRDFALPPHQHVDDAPYGGGAGMVMKPEPLTAALRAAKERLPKANVILLSPRGYPFCQTKAAELSNCEELILICGRYEGIDQRFIDLFVDQEISIGDYILMGGEVPAMVLLESSVRLIEDAIGNPSSVEEESFTPRSEHQRGLLEGPQYTRPPEFEGESVPEILLSGNHAKIARWRYEQALQITQVRRPDLLEDPDASTPQPEEE
jgi:tRNA (guanine37-N1)-methyltransferase